MRNKKGADCTESNNFQDHLLNSILATCREAYIKLIKHNIQLRWKKVENLNNVLNVRPTDTEQHNVDMRLIVQIVG